tara:strand:- start:227 stop:805 length:579 start_codon:yes stop_codon:yes gene_type:complete
MGAEEIGKNLWLLLTLGIPGCFTYGLWRLILVLNPSKIVDSELLNNVDESALLTGSIIISIALLQQIIGLFVEFILSLIANMNKDKWVDFHHLMNKRFGYSTKGLLNEQAERVIGNSFLSLNILAGIIILIFYFSILESFSFSHWILITLLFFLIINIITVIARFNNAVAIIADITEPDNHTAAPEDQTTTD